MMFITSLISALLISSSAFASSTGNYIVEGNIKKFDSQNVTIEKKGVEFTVPRKFVKQRRLKVGRPLLIEFTSKDAKHFSIHK